MQEQLRLMINLFEEKVNEAEKDYKEKHKDNFNIQKMKSSVNRKFKREREVMIKVNLIPSIKILESVKRFKY